MTSKKHRIGSIICRGMIATSLLAAAIGIQAQQSDANKTKREGQYNAAKANDPATCISEAAKMNLATIKFAQLAATKSQNAEIKRFSQALERDHKKAQTEVEALAKTHNVTLPTTLDAKCEEELTRLQGLSGEEFDKEFAKGAVEGHAMALAHLEQASTQNKDPKAADLSQYTKNMLTHVREHQQQAREVAKAVGVDQATIAALETKAKEEAQGTAGSGTETSRGTGSKKAGEPDSQTPKPNKE
jgi:putative membrane protein